MASVSTYLNFERETRQAFEFYKTIFGGDYAGEGPLTFRNVPQQEGMPTLPDDDLDLIMHVELKITGGHSLMGTDAPESMGLKLIKGNNVHINVQADTRAEADRLFGALSDGGQVTMPMADQFWGDYFGSLTDQFGVHWMVYSDR
jgi:PhnB protein